MKRLSLTIVAILLFSLTSLAQKPQDGIFNHLGVGVGAGTNGISVEFSSPLTRWIQVRAGISIMPNITIKTDADATYTLPGYSSFSPSTQTTTIDLEGGFKRTQGSIIFNIYPFPAGALYVAGGMYFGGNQLLSVKGHSDELAELQQTQGVGNTGVEIGDYILPVDRNGDVHGGLKVKNVRPYLGLGWGRAVPNKRLNFGVELGVQFMGSPKLYTDQGQILDNLNSDGDNDIQKIMDKLTVWPVLTFKLSGRIF